LVWFYCWRIRTFSFPMKTVVSSQQNDLRGTCLHKLPCLPNGFLKNEVQIIRPNKRTERNWQISHRYSEKSTNCPPRVLTIENFQTPIENKSCQQLKETKHQLIEIAERGSLASFVTRAFLNSTFIQREIGRSPTDIPNRTSPRKYFQAPIRKELTSPQTFIIRFKTPSKDSSVIQHPRLNRVRSTKTHSSSVNQGSHNTELN